MDEINGSKLYMVNLSMDARRLMTMGKMLRLPLRKVDNNYMVHCALSELFQDQSPKTFSIEESMQNIQNRNKDSRSIRVLGYSSIDKENMKKIASAFASPTVYEIINWDKTDSKPMPTEFPEGMTLGFELRTCPVIRKSSAGPKWKEGQEVDAFLSRVWEVDDPSVDLDRETIYTDWLKRQLEIREGADLITAKMKRFSIERMSRRDHTSKNGKIRQIQRPDATLTGKLEVQDTKKFKELILRGIGRHKSFGFGMLKLRRAN